MVASGASRHERPPIVDFNEDLETALADIAGPASKRPKTPAMIAELAARNEALMTYFDTTVNSSAGDEPELADILK
jgi:hypothetical protein